MNRRALLRGSLALPVGLAAAAIGVGVAPDAPVKVSLVPQADLALAAHRAGVMSARSVSELLGISGAELHDFYRRVLVERSRILPVEKVPRSGTLAYPVVPK